MLAGITELVLTTEAGRRGNLHLSTPIGFEWLVGDVSPAVLTRLPAAYDIVIHCGGGS